jgi:hypothetical protein
MMGDSTMRQVWATMLSPLTSNEFERNAKEWTRENVRLLLIIINYYNIIIIISVPSNFLIVNNIQQMVISLMKVGEGNVVIMK